MCSKHSPIPRSDDGTYPAYAWPGGYPIVYLLADGGTLCPACANGKNGSDATEDPTADKQWRLVGGDVYWEGSPMQCDHCSVDIPSAYGDPDDSDSEGE